MLKGGYGCFNVSTPCDASLSKRSEINCTEQCRELKIKKKQNKKKQLQGVFFF